jgi:hypothetical protein
MRFLYIGSRDVFSGHELGFIASLSELGKVEVVVLGSKTRAEKLFVASDNGECIVDLYEVPCEAKLWFSKRCAKIVPDYIAVIILATAGMLTHATAVSILIFSILSILVLSKVYGEIPVGYLHILSTLATLYVVLVLIRFVYTTAYVAIRPYYGDFLRFLNFLASPEGVELRITRYER